jgi:hypothetical protein
MRPLSSVGREIATPMNDEMNHRDSTTDLIPKDLQPKPYPPESPLVTSTAPRRNGSADKKATRPSQYRSNNSNPHPPHPRGDSLSSSVSDGITMKSPRGTLIVRNSESVDVGVPLMGKATRESLKARAISNGTIV